MVFLVAEVITLRLEEKERRKVTDLARKKMESKSEIMRKALLQYIEKETQIDEIKSVVAEKFAQEKISFDELVRILGFDEAKKVAFFVDIAQKSFQEGI